MQLCTWEQKNKKGHAAQQRDRWKKIDPPRLEREGTVHDRAGRRAISDDATERTMGRD